MLLHLVTVHEWKQPVSLFTSSLLLLSPTRIDFQYFLVDSADITEPKRFVFYWASYQGSSTFPPFSIFVFKLSYPLNEFIILLTLQRLCPRSNLATLSDVPQMCFEHLLTRLPPLLVSYSLSKFEHVVFRVDYSPILTLTIAQLSGCLVPETSAGIRIRHVQLQALRGLARGPRRDGLRSYN